MPNLQDTPDFKSMGINEKLEYFKEQQNKLIQMEIEFKSETQRNQVELQMAFGLTPGKPMSVVDLISIVSEVSTAKLV